ncbi:hypothetical protein BSKO_11541 [Bryopsis sp. KO-2023]|nr:hypothetical protein BSKO_11541 [Bryopsis sp. KO-2023]
MPTLNLTTNVPAGSVNSSDLLATLSKMVAEALGKPEKYVLISVTTEKPMSFGGTEDPCAYAELISIGKLGLEENKKISAVLSECVSVKLGVPSNRFYIKFVDVARQDFGWSGGTFA